VNWGRGSTLFPFHFLPFLLLSSPLLPFPLVFSPVSSFLLFPFLFPSLSLFSPSSVLYFLRSRTPKIQPGSLGALRALSAGFEEIEFGAL